jgi:hypothetical protein
MRHRRAAAAIIFALLAGSIPAVSAQAVPTAATPPPYVKPTGTVRGVITDASTGAPLSGACVDVYVVDPWAPRGQSCSGADGRYEFPALATGTQLYLRVNAAGYPGLWWPRSATQPLAFGVKLGEVKQADFALPTATATLTGVVRRPDGTPAPHALVSLYPVGDPVRTLAVLTEVDGTFTSSGIPAGDYQAVFNWDNYPNASANVTLSTATPTQVTLDIPAVTPAPVLRPRGTVTGHVATDSGAPVSGAKVQFRQGAALISGQATTDANGDYAIAEQPLDTSYYVRVSPPGKPDVWAPNSPVPKLVGVSTPGGVINAIVPEHTGTLTGRIVDFDGSAPPGTTRLNLYTGGGTSIFLGNVFPDLTGFFRVPGIKATDYKVAVLILGRAQQYYPVSPDATGATPITVQDGQTSDITVNLVPPSYLEATILDADTGAPVAGGCVQTACAGADGVALFGPLWRVTPTFDVTLQASGGHIYYPEYQTVTLTRGEVGHAVYHLRPGSAFAIPITNAGTNWICAYVVPEHIGAFAGQTCSQSADGQTVVFGPFAPGLARIFLAPGATTGAQWVSPHGGSGRKDEAAVLDLRPGQVTLAPQTTLDPAGSIGGVIRNAVSHEPIWGCAAVTGGLIQACADSDGHYSLTGLGPYTWPVLYTSGVYAAQWSTGVTVPAGGLATADVDLWGAGSIAGLGGFVPSGTTVYAYDAVTGDYLTGLQFAYPADVMHGFGTGRVVLRAGDCWLRQKTILGGSSPYFGTRLGETVSVNAADLTCTAQEPRLLREPVRRGLPPEPATVLPRRTVPDAPRATADAQPFGRWVQAQLAALVP